MRMRFIVTLALAAVFGLASAAMASSYNFSFNGSGITISGVLSVSPGSSPGVDEITGISGTFSDTNVGVSGAITGLYLPVSYVSDTLATPGIAFTQGGLSYDDLFYPAGNSPAICYDLVDGVPTLTYPFSGGQFDIFGVTFNIAGPEGYVGEIWSNGDIGGGPIVYAAGLANANGLVDDPNSGPNGTAPPGEYGTFTSTQTPEPSSLILFGIGLLGIAALRGRKDDGVRLFRLQARSK